jgi:hypothetical protein
MSWGHAFSSAWRSATDSAKRATAAIATGAAVVERAVVHAATTSAKWTSDKAVQTTNWAKAAAIGASRGTSVAVGDAALSVAGVLDNVHRAFGTKRPRDPMLHCPPVATANDIDFDGCVMSYPNGPNGPCGPITTKGALIGPNQIAAAEANAYQCHSKCCENMRKSGAPPRTIAYVNGIRTKKDDFCQTIKAIGKTTCATVYGIYNATEGTLPDGEQTSTDRSLILQATKGQPFRTNDGRNPAVDSMAHLIAAKAFQKQPIEIWAHSQGGAITSLALYEARFKLFAANHRGSLDGVQVKSFGSAAPNWPDGPSYEHYVHINDFTPVAYGLGDQAATDRANAGSNSRVIRFSGSPSGGPFKTVNLDKNPFPSLTGNHDIAQTYLKMEKQIHGGCP